MAIDAIACEPQFLDHLAPVWRALPESVRGRLIVDDALIERARSRGVEAEGIRANAIRRASDPPRARKGDGPIAFCVSIGDIKVGRRLGYRRFVFMEHGAGQAYIGERDPFAGQHPSYSGGIDREDVELFLVPNEYSANLWQAAYPDARVEIVGCPRLDDLPARQPGDGPTISLSFHWPAFVSQEAGSAIGHYLGVLPELARTFTTIGHAHPKADWPARMQRYYQPAGIEFVFDFDEVCRRADVYVCDNSSTLFEFAATGRPVVVLNMPQYRRNIRHGGRFWDWATVGIQVDQPGQLIGSIREALQDAPERRVERERVLGLVYGEERAGAAQRAAAAVASWVGSREAVAA